MLDLAIHILKSKKARFDPDKFEDRYESALIDLIKAKQAGKPAPKTPEARPSNVINLMDALKRSVRAETDRGKAAGSSRGGASRRTARASSARPRTTRQRPRARRAG
jgi:DNA end-binding protein Ku